MSVGHPNAQSHLVLVARVELVVSPHPLKESLLIFQWHSTKGQRREQEHLTGDVFNLPVFFKYSLLYIETVINSEVL
jgi:hypothetical protein